MIYYFNILKKKNDLFDNNVYHTLGIKFILSITNCIP